MDVTVELSLTFKLVKVLNKKELRAENGRVLASKLVNLPLKEEDLVFIEVTRVVFLCNEWLFCKKCVLPVVDRVFRDLLVCRRFDRSYY